jgi:hypothetical protein
VVQSIGIRRRSAITKGYITDEIHGHALHQ